MGVVKVVVWSWNEMVRQEWGGGPGAEAIRSAKHRPGRRGQTGAVAVRLMRRRPGRRGRPSEEAIRSMKRRPGRRGLPSEEAIRSMKRRPGCRGRPGAVAIRSLFLPPAGLKGPSERSSKQFVHAPGGPAGLVLQQLEVKIPAKFFFFLGGGEGEPRMPRV